MTDQEIKQKAEELFARMEADILALQQLQEKCSHPERYEGFYSWRPGCVDNAYFCSTCRKMLGFVNTVS